MSRLGTVQAAACDGKHRFPNGAQAHRVGRAKPYPVNIYHCRFCGGFHIGSAISELRRQEA